MKNYKVEFLRSAQEDLRESFGGASRFGEHLKRKNGYERFMQFAGSVSRLSRRLVRSLRRAAILSGRFVIWSSDGIE